MADSMKIDTSDACVKRMVNALPFATMEAGLDETRQLIILLWKENKKLKDEIEKQCSDAAVQS